MPSMCMAHTQHETCPHPWQKQLLFVRLLPEASDGPERQFSLWRKTPNASKRRDVKLRECCEADGNHVFMRDGDLDDRIHHIVNRMICSYTHIARTTVIGVDRCQNLHIPGGRWFKGAVAFIQAGNEVGIL